MGDALTIVTSNFHTCASPKKLPSSLVTQSSENPPQAVGGSFAADVIKHNKQLILLLSECSISYTTTCLISDETCATLRDALAHLLIELHPLDGPRAVIRVDSAPGFLSLARNDILKLLSVWFDVTINKNPVAEKAVQELESEFLRQMPRRGSVSITDLAVATAYLNLCLRYHGLSA